jgi:glutamine synthetase
MSQIVAGLSGIEQAIDPGPEDDDPYASSRPLLPKSLATALDALEGSTLFREALGDVFVNYFLALKRSEAGRYREYLRSAGISDAGDETTAWEQNEYFDFF